MKQKIKDQTFQTITKSQIKKLEFNLRKPLTWGILLNDGEIIFGNLNTLTVSLGAWVEPVEEFKSLSRKEINNSISFHMPFKGVYVPLDAIKSIFGVFSPYPFYGVITAQGKWVDDWILVEDSMKTKYNIFVSHQVGYKIDKWKKLDQIKNITFDGPTALYSDWEWFQSMSGGINNIGIGIGPVSGNVGWNKSLNKIFWNKIEGSINRSLGEAIIKGHIKILRKTIEIEGEAWTKLNVITKNNDMMVVCKRKKFMFPIKYFNKINSLLTIYGEKIEFTGDSKKITILKVRGIAFRTMRAENKLKLNRKSEKIKKIKKITRERKQLNHRKSEK